MSTTSFDMPRDVPRDVPRDASDSVPGDASGDARPGESDAGSGDASGDARPGESDAGSGDASGDARPGESDAGSGDVSGDARPGESGDGSGDVFGDARPGESGAGSGDASGDACPGESGDGAGADRARAPGAYRDEDFPGCESFHLPAGELESFEGRLEFWDGATETAWKVCEPTSIYHERPSRRLGRMAERVGSLRGSAIESFGSADLLRRDATGRKRWLVQADEVLYLHPDRVRIQGPAIEVDVDPLPDVVLEVDHTTDVRCRKLGIYMESGFPEIWVLVLAAA